MNKSNKISVLGVGPGHPSYVLPIVFDIAKSCDVLVGGKRNLQLFENFNKEKLFITGDIDSLIKQIKHLRKTKKIGVLVSGDPGLYSFMHTLLRYFDKQELDVIPGISSLQYLFSKGKLPWNDAYITSLHGQRNSNFVEIVKNNKKVALLTDTLFPVNEIAKFLYNNGIRNRRFLIGENLSYENEKITDLTIEKCMEIKVSKLCVVVIYDER